MKNKKNTSKSILLKAYEIGKETGLKHIYLGNVLDKEYNTTYCPKCHKALIERYGFKVDIIGLEDGHCKYCQCVIKGVWR